MAEGVGVWFKVRRASISSMNRYLWDRRSLSGVTVHREHDGYGHVVLQSIQDASMSGEPLANDGIALA